MPLDTFSDGIEGLVIKFRLLYQAPNFRNEKWPKDKARDQRRNNVHPEDADACLSRQTGPGRFDLDVERGLHPENGFEKAALMDTHEPTPAYHRLARNLVTLHPKMLHDVVRHRGEIGQRNWEIASGLKQSHERSVWIFGSSMLEQAEHAQLADRIGRQVFCLGGERPLETAQ